MLDRYDQPLSTASAAARDAYVQGVDRLLCAQPGAQALLQAALQADPGFALAWIALARARLLEADAAGARDAAAQARKLADGATARERDHVHALALGIAGRGADALAATRQHLAAHPRDAFVLAPATGVFGLLGFSGRAQREHELHDWMATLAPALDGDWWFDGAFAFAQCESGRADAARARIERSLQARPDSANGAHILAHVLHEQGDAPGARDFLEGWLPGYARAGAMHCHLSWHLALTALAQGDAARAWQVYRDAVRPGGPAGSWGPPLNAVTDASSFLWRAALAGQPVGADDWAPVHAYARQNFPNPGVSFADVHVALACAAAGDTAGLQSLVQALDAQLADGRLGAGAVVPALARAWGDFVRGDAAAVVSALQPVLHEVVRIGGSRAQRDLVGATLHAALRQLGREDEAAALPACAGTRPRAAGV